MAEHVTTTPNGTEIVFEDGEPDEKGERKQRSYRVDGEKLTSVTTILGVLAKPGLKFAAEKLTVEGMLWLAKEGLLPQSLDEALEALTDNNRRFWQVWQSKADRGTLTHEELLRLALGEELEDLDRFPLDQQGMIRGAADWFAERRPQAVDTEIMVASKRFGYAGRHDFYGSMVGMQGNGLIDFKTTEKLPRYASGTVRPPYNEHLLQLGGYEGARVESGYQPSAWHAVVRIDATGQHHTWIGKVDSQRFVELIDAYRAQSGIVSASKLPVPEAVAA